MYENERFKTPDNFKPWGDRYDMPSELLQDLDQRKPVPYQRRSFPLDTAKSASDPLIIPVPGRSFQLLGFVTASAIKASVDILVNVRLNEPSYEPLTMKHGRGYRGDFRQLILDWPAQPSNSFEIFIFYFNDVPFMVQDRF